MTRRFAHRVLRSFGYTLRDVGRGVGGVDLMHDARVLLGDASGLTVFDVGANVGQTCLDVLDRYRAPRIYSFEPSPTTFEALRRAMQGRAGVTVEPIALGDRVTKMPFHVTRDHSVNDSLLAPTWDAGGTVVEVDVETVDTYCERRGLESIDLLKIDAQGFDLQVLRGASRLLSSQLVKTFCCEAHFVPLYVGQTSLRDLLDLAGEHGYKLVGFYEQTYVDNVLQYLNALFARPGLR